MPVFCLNILLKCETLLKPTSFKDTLSMVNGNCDALHLDLAKKFLQFCNTDYSMGNFNKIVGMARPLQYSLTQEQRDTMSMFSHDMYNAHSEGRVVYPQSTNKVYLSAPSTFVSISAWSTQTSQGAFAIPAVAFYNNKTLSSKDYFDGLSAFKNKTWCDSNFADYYG